MNHLIILIQLEQDGLVHGIDGIVVEFNLKALLHGLTLAGNGVGLIQGLVHLGAVRTHFSADPRAADEIELPLRRLVDGIGIKTVQPSIGGHIEVSCYHNLVHVIAQVKRSVQLCLLRGT